MRLYARRAPNVRLAHVAARNAHKCPMAHLGAWVCLIVAPTSPVGRLLLELSSGAKPEARELKPSARKLCAVRAERVRCAEHRWRHWRAVKTTSACALSQVQFCGDFGTRARTLAPAPTMADMASTRPFVCVTRRFDSDESTGNWKLET